MNNNLPTLICTVGLPRAGKTKWAKAYGSKHNAPVLNLLDLQRVIDEKRCDPDFAAFVVQTARVFLSCLFTSGYETVILEAPNITKLGRDCWNSETWNTVFQVIDTPKDECLVRALGDEPLLAAIKQMADIFEPLNENEIRLDTPTDEKPFQLTAGIDPVAGLVKINFGKAVSWFGLQAREAHGLGQTLTTLAIQLNQQQRRIIV